MKNKTTFLNIQKYYNDNPENKITYHLTARNKNYIHNIVEPDLPSMYQVALKGRTESLLFPIHVLDILKQVLAFSAR